MTSIAIDIPQTLLQCPHSPRGRGRLLVEQHTLASEPPPSLCMCVCWGGGGEGGGDLNDDYFILQAAKHND